MLLDIIVTHWTEPYEVGEKFFDMLKMQRGADFRDVRVTVIHDGTEPFPEETFRGFPCEVRQKQIPHGGISAARNAGIDTAEAKWIMFCDFDDMFSGAYSLRNILNVLGTDDYDILWEKFYAEDMTKDGETILNLRGENTVFIHGKVFRTAWLKKSGLRFDTMLKFNEDSAFCTIASLMIPNTRIGEITSEAPGYIWCFRPESSTGSQLNKVDAIIGAWQRDKLVCEAFRKYAEPNRHSMMVARAVCDAYWSMCLEKIPEKLKPYVDEFWAFYKANAEAFQRVTEAEFKEVEDASRREHEIAVQEEERRWGDDGTTKHRGIALCAWLAENKNRERNNAS